MRLDKFISSASQLSRSDARRCIRGGQVCVNGQVCRAADAAVDEQTQITLNGEALQSEPFVYLMLYKPAGVVSASRDGREQTVVDLVRGDFPRRELFPAGRLDKTSTGFVLLTDDGAFAHDILAPRRHVPKTYTVQIDTPLTEQMRQGFAEGVTLADGKKLAAAEVRASSEDGMTVQVTLRQGVYHQIKRMFGVYGAGVNALHRTAVGSVRLDEALQPGQYRRLRAEELQQLKDAARR